MCRVHLAQQGSLGDGVELGAMEPEACLDRRAPRVTVALTAWQGCLERRATGVTLALLGHQDLQETTEKGVMMEKSGPGGCLGSLGHVVCLDQRGLQALPDLPA